MDSEKQHNNKNKMRNKGAVGIGHASVALGRQCIIVGEEKMSL
jgi:hypothetical protein